MSTPVIYHALRSAVTTWSVLNDEQWHAFAALFHLRHVDAQAYVTLPGATTHELVFVYDGLLRFFYTAESGKETNKAFVAAGEFAGPLASAELALPLYFGIQALEPTTLLAAPFATLRQLYEQGAAFERFGRKLAESLLTRKELRMRALLEQSATERYLDFVRHYPDLTARVPQYHLASYLGITDVSLSRIRGELRQAASSALPQ